MGKHWAEVAWIDGSIVTIPLFRIDIPASSEGVRFGAQTPGAEADGKVELGEVLRPTGLTTGKNFSGREIFQVLMIRDHVNRSAGAFEVVLPDMESLEYC